MTGLKSNINQVVERFKLLAADAKNMDFSEALIGGTNATRGKLSFRVFNKGSDSFNMPFGKYTGQKVGRFTPYEYKRVKRGRQIAKKDLEFEGDLRRSIRVVKRQKNSVICVITNKETARIGRYQEEQLSRIHKRPVVIWRLTPEEKKFFMDNVSALIKQQYDRAIRSK